MHVDANTQVSKSAHVQIYTFTFTHICIRVTLLMWMQSKFVYVYSFALWTVVIDTNYRICFHSTALFCLHPSVTSLNYPTWFGGRKRMAVEIISWPISTKDMWPATGLELMTPGLKSDYWSYMNVSRTFLPTNEVMSPFPMGLFLWIVPKSKLIQPEHLEEVCSCFADARRHTYSRNDCMLIKKYLWR